MDMNKSAEGIEKVVSFMAELAELQDKYELFIVTETEEPILVSMEPNANNHNIVCYTNNVVIDELSLEAAEFDMINVEKYAND